MRRILIVFTFVFLLSGCSTHKYDNGTSQINDMTQLESIMADMMKEGNQDDSTMVPHDMVGSILRYDSGMLTVLTVYYNINTEFDGEVYRFDTFSCHDYEDELLCKEEKDLHGREELNEEIYLSDAVELISNIDIEEIVAELKDTYDIYIVEYIVISVTFEDFNEQSIDLSELENTSVYYDGEFHYDEVYTPESIMLKVRVDFVAESEGEQFYIYFEGN